MYVLGVESSCDETAAAIYDTSHAGLDGLRAQILMSQSDVHAPYGGVVPELASRDHIRMLLPIVQQALGQAGLDVSALDGIAYTAGPGLAGALLVGAGFSRSFAWALGVPAIAVHHLEGHLLAPFMVSPALKPPCLALLVSGGHTLLVWVKEVGQYTVVGQTLDDAVGEAFDKVASLLDLPYPGGPALAALAEHGEKGRFQFTRPMIDRPGLDMSFSGLKTQVSVAWHACDQSPQVKADIASGFEEAVVQTLCIKCRRALASLDCSRLIVAGGVGANRHLRSVLTKTMAELQGEVHFPPPYLCTDNGAMIAFAGAQRLLTGQRTDGRIQVQPRWEISSLPPL